MRLSRLTALRLTELEVHHVDLDVGYRVTDCHRTLATRTDRRLADAFKHAFPGP
jgi:hypothetical protein